MCLKGRKGEEEIRLEKLACALFSLSLSSRVFHYPLSSTSSLPFFFFFFFYIGFSKRTPFFVFHFLRPITFVLSFFLVFFSFIDLHLQSFPNVQCLCGASVVLSLLFISFVFSFFLLLLPISPQNKTLSQRPLPALVFVMPSCSSSSSNFVSPPALPNYRTPHTPLSQFPTDHYNTQTNKQTDIQK